MGPSRLPRVWALNGAGRLRPKPGPLCLIGCSTFQLSSGPGSTPLRSTKLLCSSSFKPGLWFVVWNRIWLGFGFGGLSPGSCRMTALVWSPVSAASCLSLSLVSVFLFCSSCFFWISSSEVGLRLEAVVPPGLSNLNSRLTRCSCVSSLLLLAPPPLGRRLSFRTLHRSTRGGVKRTPTAPVHRLDRPASVEPRGRRAREAEARRPGWRPPYRPAWRGGTDELWWVGEGSAAPDVGPAESRTSSRTEGGTERVQPAKEHEVSAVRHKQFRQRGAKR